METWLNPDLSREKVEVCHKKSYSKINKKAKDHDFRQKQNPMPVRTF